MVTLDSKWNTFLSQNEKQKFFDPIQVIFSRIEAQERKFLHIFLEPVSSFFERMNSFLLGTRAACFIIMMIVMALLILAFAIEGPAPYYSSTSLTLNTRSSSVSDSIKSHDSNSQFVNDAWRVGGGGGGVKGFYTFRQKKTRHQPNCSSRYVYPNKETTHTNKQ